MVIVSYLDSRFRKGNTSNDSQVTTAYGMGERTHCVLISPSQDFRWAMRDIYISVTDEMVLRCWDLDIWDLA